MRGFFAIGAEGISKPMNLGDLVRSAHAFGASFVFLVDTPYAVRRATSDTSQAEFQLPVYDFADACGAPAAARLPPGRLRAGRRRHRPAELPPSAERRLRLRPGAQQPFSRDAGAVRPCRAHPDALLHQPRRRRRDRHVRPAALPRPLRAPAAAWRWPKREPGAACPRADPAFRPSIASGNRAALIGISSKGRAARCFRCRSRATMFPAFSPGCGAARRPMRPVLRWGTIALDPGGNAARPCFRPDPATRPSWSAATRTGRSTR